jgi:hypothetical protein
MLAVAGLIGVATAAGASPPSGVSSHAGSAGTQVGGFMDDPSVTNFNCANIAPYHIDRQLNLRAALILQKCGYAPPVSGIGAPSGHGAGSGGGGGNSTKTGIPPVVRQLAGAGAGPLLGGTDADVILPDGAYPYVTQSEAMNWVHGSTVVVNYNDSRTTPAGCLSGISYSTDGGATFQHLGQPLCSGHAYNYGDPIVAYNAALSTWYAGDLVTGCGGLGVGLWTSPDGITWSSGACAHNGNGAGDDRDSMWVDNNPSSPHYGRMYVSFNNFDVDDGALQLIYSDNGTSWSSPATLAPSYLVNAQVTGDLQGSGKVYVAAMDPGSGGLSSRTNYMFRSTDGGATWATSIMGAAFQVQGRVAHGYFALAFSTMWRTFGFGQPAAAGNNVYYDWAQCGQNVVCSGATDHGDIYFQRSTDSGVTWSTPLKLNTDSGTAMQWAPSLAATVSGAIYAGWYDERDTNGGADLDCAAGNPSQPCYRRWGRVSLDGGATWQADEAVGDILSPLPAQPDPYVYPTYEGDYDYITSDGDTIYDHWTDGRVAINNTSQQDVFLDRINVQAYTPTPTETGTPPTNTPTLSPTNTATVTPAVCGMPAWQAGPTMPPDRYGVQGAVGSDGKVYVATGIGADNTPLPAQMAQYDPATNNWSDVAPPPVAVGEYAMAADGGKVYIAGGNLGGTGNSAITTTLQIYDIASNTWSFGTSMPGRVEGAAGAILNGKFYVVGGDNYYQFRRTTFIYDITTNSWSAGPLIPDTNGRGFTSGTAAGGLVYVWGGTCNVSGQRVTIDTLIAYDPGTNSWTTLAAANTGGLGNWGGVSPYGNGQLLVTDGGAAEFVPSASTHIYNIASNSWTSGPTMLEPRMGHAQATLPDGRVFVYGGLGFGINETSELLSTPPCATPTEEPTDTPTPGVPTGTGTAIQATATSSATAMGTDTPIVTATACTITFSDVPPGSTFYSYIHCLACLGIINGYPDGTFKPNANVTRGQLSKIVSNSAGFHDPQPNQMFEDVPVGSTFQLYIGRLASRGYTNGYPCGGTGEPCVPPGNLPYFRPNNNATRGQISKIVSNAAGFSDPPAGQQFEDVAVGSAFYTYAYRLVRRGVMSGYPCGGAGEPCIPPGNLPYFRPNNNATRGQTAKIVANTFFPDCSARP